VTQVLAVVGTLGVITSVFFAGWQSREVAKQTKIQNSLAGANSLRQVIDGLHSVLGRIADRPELRPFFYDGQPCPPDEPLRSTVLTIAEMMADQAEVGLLTHQRVATTNSLEDWNDYVDFLVEHSPAIADHLAAHPQWWPLTAARRTEAKRSARDCPSTEALTDAAA